MITAESLDKHGWQISFCRTHCNDSLPKQNHIDSNKTQLSPDVKTHNTDIFY